MCEEKKVNAKERKEWLRRLDRRVINPLMMTFAGRRVYTVVDHVGRHSKRQYHTPVLGRPNGNDFYIPLPYGEDTDWCLNVLAAGACTVHWNGQTYQLSLPQIVGRAVGEIVYAPMYRFLLHASGVKKYLQAKQVPG
jgi:hypothetical protein